MINQGLTTEDLIDWKASVQTLFANTGPTGQRAIGAMAAKVNAALTPHVKAKTLKRSIEYGNAISAHIINWSLNDGGADVQLMGFASDYKVDAAPSHWKPTGSIRLQQLPLLPKWGDNRTFAMASATACSLPPPPAYSEDMTSDFYKEAIEVYDTVKALTPEQKLRYAALVAESAGRSNTRGRIYLLDAQGKAKAYNVRLGITDGTSTELLVSPNAPEANDLKEGASVIIGTVGGTGPGNKPAAGGPRMPF